jgi:nucleotide-binding universal stress UspA family protein
MDTERLVVATDGGEASSAALEWAIQRSATVPMRIEVTTVSEDWLSLIFGAQGGFRPVYEKLVQDAIERVRIAAPDVPVASSVRDGVPSHQLVQASADADLIVVGNRKVGGVAGAVYGSLPLRLAAASACPTAVVPADWEPVAGPVVVGVGDNPDDRAAAEFAAREAQRTGSKLVVVHAWEIPPVVTIDVLGPRNVVPALEKAHSDILAKDVARLRDAHPGLEIEAIVQQGPAADVVAGHAKAASLLVVGRHGEGALEGFVLGSVSHGVLLELPCPVIVVP